ncbi:MAG: hypothetical protein ACON41_00380 [Parvibaculales bacterium]
MDILEIYWAPTLVGAGLVYFFGAFWYSPYAFGESFNQLHGLSDKGWPVPGLFVEAIYTLLLAWLIGLFFALQFEHAIVIGIGPIFFLTVVFGRLAGAIWKQYPAKAVLIDIGHFALSVAILLAMQFGFRLV